MKYVCEDSLNSFNFWSGGKDTADTLTYEELETLDSLLEDFYCDELPTDTEINDFFGLSVILSQNCLDTKIGRTWKTTEIEKGSGRFTLKPSTIPHGNKFEMEC